MIELLYLTHNRLEFTKASLAQLIRSTNWRRVSRFIVYDDQSTDGTFEHAQSAILAVLYSEIRRGEYGGPVAIMNDYLSRRDPRNPQLFAKIDSDTILPPGWLDVCLDVMHLCPELDLLGIEAFCDVNSDLELRRSYKPAPYIGGIGLMRSSSFVTLPRPNGLYGFTAWQDNSPEVTKGWIDPALPVFLLDRLPQEPWRSLSQEYIAKGWQRPWQTYDTQDRVLWSWWHP